jgi:hypothetical protein
VLNDRAKLAQPATINLRPSGEYLRNVLPGGSGIRGLAKPYPGRGETDGLDAPEMEAFLAFWKV